MKLKQFTERANEKVGKDICAENTNTSTYNSSNIHSILFLGLVDFKLKIMIHIPFRVDSLLFKFHM